ncbi:MAG: inositol monophosphatase [Candidatus Falkowbacteria bacterium]|nr:MAG: inositol monophosphatase [Candidatus Falkowbacteria bacterium]
MSKFQDIAIKAAQEAGKILMAHYGQLTEIRWKEVEHGAVSIVTDADIKSEAKIISILKAEFPEFGIYGEESGGQNMEADYVWYVDPLDGTNNFSRNIPFFGISIGLVYQGQPIVGILYFPTINLLLSAEEGQGCWANSKKVQVSKRSLAESLYYAGGKFRNQTQMNLNLAQSCGLIKIIDASSYELAQISMGDAEIYHLTNVPHDVAAGVCLIREAGGIVTEENGAPWDINSKTILATNGVIHQEVVEILKTNTK